jgi:hypothetical protein
VPVVGPRFLIEAGFIIAVAVVAGIARLSTAWILLVMAAAWIVVAVVELVASQRRRRTPPRRGQEDVPARPAPPPSSPPPSSPPVTRPEPQPLEPMPEAKTEAKPEAPKIVAVPPPPPEPEQKRAPVPEPEPEPEPEPVVPITREWNLWELERAAREHAGGDVARDEERSYLLMYLREFAGPDGMLPPDFDGLVRDAFGDLLHAVGT